MFKSIFNVTVRTSFFFLLWVNHTYIWDIFLKPMNFKKMASTTWLHENETEADEKYGIQKGSF